MSSAPGNLKASLAGRRRTRRISSRRRLGSRACGAPRRSFNNGGRKSKCSSKTVSAKLETLKSLISPSHAGKTLKADELFQETADYIVLLRTQVVILQRLVELYGSSEKENIAAAAATVL
ncbi:hypothetical protein GBA52_012217 [Prunus armeniaca]|nr:hypothetical protein GBA52_012217 [Prunus armeniaca]